MSPPDPPLDQWSHDGAMRALEQLARDLPHVDAATAAARLSRLTAEQREAVEAAIGAFLPSDLAPPGSSENGSPPASS